MNKRRLILIFFIVASMSLKAQTATSADDLFKTARDAAFQDNNYDKAKQIAYHALAISPTYTDIEIFLGRVCAWSNQYDSARYHFSKALQLDSLNEDANIAFIDLEYWNDHYKNAMQICDKAMSFFQASQNLLIRKAKLLNATKNYHEADAVVGQLLKINKDNKEAIALSLKIKNAVAVNKITVSYDNSSFDKQYDQAWHLASISYGRKTKLGSVIARINYANRFGSGGLQGEIDAYPRISKTFYSYVNFGYSGDVGVFPKYRAGFSLYANLPHAFEAEAGLRYLYFEGATNIYTFSVGKYYKNFLFSARTYITPLSSYPASVSYSLRARYYFESGDDYLSLSAGTGISPDENNQSIQFGSKQNRLTSKQVAVGFSHTFLKWNVASFSAGLIREEYLPGARGNQFNISVGISHRF
jgi:YaiO family outer membrane protein